VIGVDTNVLVRFLTADEPEQYRLALAFFQARSPADPAFVSAVTLAETVWLLRRRYRLPADAIAESVNMLLNSDDFVIEGSSDLHAVRQGTAAPSRIADLLVGHLGRRAGCRSTVTFDPDAAKAIPSMELLA
jgi:predicted nucleic-acid-binding protein